ncbi:M23 family metallopeptidase [Streptomyces sp. MI02-7b]|uniref:M23 family metallopeptidase n=1 Tax=Streptomyces sp. MI02-7b TaxID=462941 RepID=UPI0029A70E56|nr:peptidoglycan DD-metalloendopeptidase family protein [Streptomyces sp. MI02-7b]MDX3071886.1 peptidoglycan DD-metalloendopeptidase family protein [Streptomyces sp. MI02-7b]
MNDRHPSGYAPEYNAYGHEGYSSASYPSAGAVQTDDDPLFGTCQGYPAYDTGTQATGSWDTTATGYWQPPDPTAGYGDPAAAATGTWYAQPAAETYDYPAYEHAPVYEYQEPEPALPHEPLTHETLPHEAQAYVPHAREPEAGPHGTGIEDWADGEDAYAFDGHDAAGHDLHGDDLHGDGPHGAEPEEYDSAHDADDAGYDADPDGAPVLPRPRAGSRRRRPARRSALLTVAVPSVAVMGVAACAAAVTVTTEEGDTSTTQADGIVGAKTPTTKLDQQLAGVNRDVDDFASRASRTQERLDIKERQAAERKKKAQEAARKEALRPKFLLPVTEHGLSAYFGQAGVNWMSVHTGIDFPVSYGTPVMAATDGTVRTQWNSAYGNMAIVTAPDGTETWYCHLSSTKIRWGSVKAGEVIAYSGNSGNSTGPHLHFEVRPAGGSAIDPLPWLLKHGLDPR